MSEVTQARPLPVQVVANSEVRHRVLVTLTVAASIVLGVAMAIYGWSYYILPQAQRPFSYKHIQLKPSGTVGLKLGMFGFSSLSLSICIRSASTGRGLHIRGGPSTGSIFT